MTAWLATIPSTSQVVPSIGRSGLAISLSVSVSVTPSLVRVSVSPSRVIVVLGTKSLMNTSWAISGAAGHLGRDHLADR